MAFEIAIAHYPTAWRDEHGEPQPAGWFYRLHDYTQPGGPFGPFPSGDSAMERAREHVAGEISPES